MWLTFSILAAFSFGIRGMLYHWTSQKPINRNLLLCGVFGMGAVVNAICAAAFASEWSIACLVGVQMGLFSFGANASMFKGFAVGKASLVAVLTALPSVVVVLVAYAVWNEQLHLMQLLAFLVIIAGVLLVRYSNELTLRNLQGAQWGLLAMLLFAGNDLSGKWSTILHAELYPTLFYMFATGTACFGLWWLSDVRRERSNKDETAVLAKIAGAEAIEPSSSNWGRRKTFLTGMAVGITNTIGMFFIIYAFDLGKAGLVSSVVALNVPLMLLYTRFVVKERFSRTELAGIVLSLAGILLMKLFGT